MDEVVAVEAGSLGLELWTWPVADVRVVAVEAVAGDYLKLAVMALALLAAYT